MFGFIAWFLVHLNKNIVNPLGHLPQSSACLSQPRVQKHVALVPFDSPPAFHQAGLGSSILFYGPDAQLEEAGVTPLTSDLLQMRIGQSFFVVSPY